MGLAGSRTGCYRSKLADMVTGTLLATQSRVLESRRQSSLRGRGRECAVLDQLLVDIRQGVSRSLVLPGEVGIGKTALLQYLIESATDLDVVRAAGVKSEMELAYAGLQQLCAPMLAHLERLPAPQREALETVFGLGSGGAPDRFLVGLGVLTLVSEAAEERPLLFVIDDAQWLDQASALTLAFVARRLLAEPVGLVFAAREPGPEFSHLALLEVDELRDGDARALLASAAGFALDQRVRDRIVAECRGNPSALLELRPGLTATQLAGGFGVLAAPSLCGRIEQRFRRRLSSLSDEVRRLLVLAAAEPIGDPLLFVQASAQLGIDVFDIAAKTNGLLTPGNRVMFRHPVLRSVVYRSAASDERRAAHQALAQATDPEADPDWHAWHLACAAAGPDERIASELERSVGRAKGRGGLAAAAAFLQRSVVLTRERARRTDRALAAARTSLQAGAVDAARELVSTAEAGPLDEFQRARIALIRAQLAFAVNRRSDGAPLLLKAAEQLAPLDPRLARETYLEALFAAVVAGRLGQRAGVPDVARAARSAPAAANPPGAADLLLDGYALAITEGYAVGAPILQQALKALRSEAVDSDDILRWGLLASYAAQALWDEESYRALPTRQIQLARQTGALPVLPMSLTLRIEAHLHAGELEAAASMLEDLDALTDVAPAQVPRYAAIAVACARGREADARERVKVGLDAVVARGEGIGLAFIERTAMVLYNALGKYGDALSMARPATEGRADLQSPPWLQELVEAAVRTGERQLASDALEELAGMTRIIGTAWALGIEARSRALLSDGAAAEDLYRRAIDHLERSEARIELARAHLLYGEWLRRESRRADARAQLRTAYHEFTARGWEAFADRARSELQATGEKVRKRTVETRDDLTAQERQIADLARGGLSNPEIGARLFLSSRTVEWHLRKVFSKLGISSRRELTGALASPRSGLVPA